MSMHMIHGVVVHGSKKKVNKKPGWRQREEEHRQWLMKHGIDPDKKSSKKSAFVALPTQAGPYQRETKYYPSLGAAAGNAPKKDVPVYSGDYIVGIATMHKSNLVPVGRGDNPVDYATMRRS